MFNKNTTLLLFALLLILILLVLFLFFRNTPNKPVASSPAPIPIFQNTSTPSPQTRQEDQLKKQTQADINYAQLQDKVLKEYPWYNSLPLQNQNYFVLFDLQKKVIRAKIYPQKNLSTPVDDQVKSYQQEITDKLKKLGIDTTLYPIEWSINPE